MKKKRCSLMVKGRIEFSISFLEPGGNYVPNGNVQLLCCINSNCVFSKTIPLWGQASQSVSRQGSYIGSFLNLKIVGCYVSLRARQSCKLSNQRDVKVRVQLSKLILFKNQ